MLQRRQSFNQAIAAFVNEKCRLHTAFGTARLVKKSDGPHELIGGTADDHAAAREWCSLFAPEIVFKSGGRTGTDSARSAFYSRRAALSRASFFA